MRHPRLALCSFVLWPLVSSTPIPPRSPSPIVPAYLGLWEAREVFVIDADGYLRVDTTRIDPELSTKDILPYGQHVKFADGYDAKSDASYLVMQLLPPFSPRACQYPIMLFLPCDAKDNYGQRPDNTQQRNREYDLTISKGADGSFAPVGATANEVTYFLQAGHEWDGEFYVSKDRQRMWCRVGIAKFKAGPAGRTLIDHVVPGFQLFHRLAEYKRR